MTETKVEDWLQLTESEEEESCVPLTESQLSERVLIRLDLLFRDLFEYITMDNDGINNDAYNFFKKLQETYNRWEQLTEDQIDSYYGLIDEIRCDIIASLRQADNHEGYNISEKIYQDAFVKYRNKYAMIFK